MTATVRDWQLIPTAHGVSHWAVPEHLAPRLRVRAQSPAVGETASGAWSPWRYLRRHHGDVRVYETELPGDMLGCIDMDQRIIWLDSRLTEAERRSVLTHEIGHLERGLPCDRDASNATDVTERAIDQWAARQLIPIHALARAFQWADRLPDIAEELWVHERLLRARLRCLTDDEQDTIMAALQHSYRLPSASA